MICLKRMMLVGATVFSGVVLYAQDLITKKDGTDIQAKVLEINVDDIKFNPHWFVLPRKTTIFTPKQFFFASNSRVMTLYKR